MNDEDQLSSRIRAAFEHHYRPPAPGFDARLRAGLNTAPGAPMRHYWLLQFAAVILVTAVVLVLLLPRLLSIHSPSPITGPAPTPSPSAISLPPAMGLWPWQLQMTGAGSGWFFAGDRIYHTVDDGVRWTDVSLSPVVVVGDPPLGFAVAPDRAFLAVPSVQNAPSLRLRSVTFYETGDGGVTWQKLGIASITGTWLDRITFSDSSHGWLLVDQFVATGPPDARLWGTVDGGRSWTQLTISSFAQLAPGLDQSSQGCQKTGITFADAKTGWLNGICPDGPLYLYRTVDGGRTWQAQSLPEPSNPLPGTPGHWNTDPPIFFNPSSGLLPVEYRSSAGNVPDLIVYVTRDGGVTWSASTPVSGGQTMAAASPQYWIVTVPPRRLAFTHDGQRYDLVASDTDLGWTQVKQLSFTDPQHGFAIVATQDGRSELVRTQDGGAHWKQVPLGA